MALQREKRGTKEIDRFSYDKTGSPTISNPRTCKACKSRISESETCACIVKGHPDLKNYKIDKDTMVRFSDEDSTNSSLNRIFEPNILGLTNSATNAMLGNTMQIDTGNSNAAEQVGEDQSEDETRTKQSLNSSPNRPFSHSTRNSPITLPQGDTQNQMERNTDSRKFESPRLKATYDASA